MIPIWPLGLVLLAGCMHKAADVVVHPQTEPIQVVLPNCQWNCEAVIELTTDNEGTITAGSQSGGAIADSDTTSLPTPLPIP